MKIKIGEKVYLQKYDTARILHDIAAFPGSLVTELFEPSNDGALHASIFYISSPQDELEFSCVFKDPKNVEWLMSEDWIVDHNEYIKMPVATLKSIYRHREREYKANIKYFNLQPREYRELHYGEINLKLYKEAHQLKSIRLLINELTGRITLNLPSEDLDDTRQKEPVSNIIPSRFPDGKGAIIFDISKEPLGDEQKDDQVDKPVDIQEKKPHFSLVRRFLRRIGALK